jgi:cysteine-rich repeat protein
MFPVQATFHLIKIVEIFPGTAAAPNAQYIVIQMYASGQEFVSGHAITVYNSTGGLVATFTFAGNVANGTNQAKILIATSQAASFFGISPDLTMSPTLLSAGGKVCWAGTLDCVAWGSYSGSTTGIGTPFNVAGGLISGRAAIRRLNIAGSATVLDAGDDTDNCANDFVSGLPAPRNNAGVLGKVPSATCGNGVLEGLEQCDDHNLVNGDGCSSTCALDVVVMESAAGNAGDFNDDGKSDVFWRNTSTGSNVVWRSASSATPQAVTGVTSQAWKVVGIGDFNGDGKSDVFWRNTSTGSNVVWRSASSATQQAVAAVTSQAWKVVGIGDFNGDGKSDVFWRNTSTGSNVVWQSASSATQQAVAAVTSQAWKVVPYEGQELGTTSVNASLSIGDLSISEGNSGVKQAMFVVQLSQASPSPVTYNIATANGTATADTDYVARSLTGESIAAGTTSRSFAVSIMGDTAVESNETFFVNVNSVANATMADGQGLGTILDDDYDGY